MKFLVNTMTNWDEPPRTRHHVAQVLSLKHEVVFIAANNIGKKKFSEIKASPNLTVVTPSYPLDSRIRYRLPVLNERYQKWLFRKLKKQYSGYRVINFDFSAYLVHGYFDCVIYYCNDNFTSISKKINYWPVYKYHVFCESRMIKRACLCIGTSRIITLRLKKLNPATFEIPLGGPDIEEFDLVPAAKSEKKDNLNIGLVGFIKSYNLSVKLLNDLLASLDCTITLIGPLDKEFYDRITHKERINYKGVLTGKELLEEVNRFDIAIAPYLDRKIDEGGLPNKLMIYLALGKPVVLTNLKSLKELCLPDKLIYTVKNNGDFPARITQAFSENNADLIDLRVSYAKLHTWNKRVDYLLELIN